MLCLEVRVNGELRHRAGLERGIVVSAFVNALVGEHPGFRPDLGLSPVTLTVNGIEGEIEGDRPKESRSVQWGVVGAPLALGDEVSIRIVESDTADAPAVTAMLPDLPEDEGNGRAAERDEAD